MPFPVHGSKIPWGANNENPAIFLFFINTHNLVDSKSDIKNKLKVDSGAKSPFYGFLRFFISEKPPGFNIFCGRGRPRSQEIGLLAPESRLIR
jgi:hypothetical protein